MWLLKLNLLCCICAFIIWKVSKSINDVEMLDSGCEACSRKLKSKPHPMFSFFEKKGKEVWCLPAIWFLLGKHATCWSGHALDVGAVWLKGKTKITKIRRKNKWKEPVQTIKRLVNNVIKRFARSQNAKVSFLYLSVRLWLSLEIGDCNAEIDYKWEWMTVLTKQEKCKNTLFTFSYLTKLIASSV